MRYGFFDPGTHEYVIDRVDVPQSWINYLGVENWCTVINQTAGGYSFFRSPHYGRVTRFRPNGVPVDRPGHYVYLRDDEDRDFWSVSWQPVGKPLDQARYRTRHGLSYSVFESEYHGISASQTVFVPLGEDAEVWDVRVTNVTEHPRAISVFGYVEFSFQNIQYDNENFQMSLYSAGSAFDDGVIEYEFHYQPRTYTYFTCDKGPDGFDCLRDRFIGGYRTESNPIAVERGDCSSSGATTSNHCGALHHRLVLAPGQTARLTYMLGNGDRQAGQRVREKYAQPGAVEDALGALAAYWARKRSRLTCQTPSEAMNVLLNTWTLYQAETCVTWSRFASFVEVGGRTGLGYRDTAQDTLSVAHTASDKVKRRIMELLRGQMSPGYGLHLFDPALFLPGRGTENTVGVRSPTVVPGRAADLVHGLDDACSDDHLWLVPAVVNYVVETGEAGLLDEVVPFADSALTDEERAKILGADLASEYDKRPATVMDHLVRAVEFSAAQVGDNGIARGLRADWNDCLNLGGGQSSLVSFLHVWAARVLQDFLLAAGGVRLGSMAVDAALAAHLDTIIETVSAAANNELWDGQWYVRGFTRDQVAIGSAQSEQGKIFLEHMPWAIISGVADRDRGLSSMDAIHEHLAGPYGIHLCWPSYTEIDDTIGYVTRVYPGVKENGSVFCHPNAWPVIAETMLGRGERAMEYYDALAPAWFNDNADTRCAEPYVYAQFVYGRDHEFAGKAQNPWLTGTAGWMYTAATKHILGVRPTMAGLVVDPCIPAQWDGFTVRREWRGAVYLIEVANPDHVCDSVSRVTVDGEPVQPVTGQRPYALIPIGQPGQTYVVKITLGN